MISPHTQKFGKPSSNEVGRLLIIGFDGTEMTARLASLLKRVQPAGVILFARNIKNAGQTWRLLRECRNCVSSLLFTCVDLEGGTVDRFRDVLAPAPSAAEVFATGDRTLFRRHGQVIGANCRAMGFNVDFAPVLDLASEASRAVMGSRVVSAKPRETTAYAREFLAGLESAGVLGCGKHFPGLGEGQLDSHHDLPIISKAMKKLWAEDLVPYRALAGRLPFVMVSHAAYPRVTNDRSPASLSRRWITDILRKRMGYRHLIVSDDLEMGGVLSAAPVGEAAVQFVRAGGNLCLVCHREDYVLQAHEELIKEGERDRQFAQRVAESIKRAQSFKKKWATKMRTPAAPPSQRTIDQLTRKLWEFAEQVRLEGMEREFETGRASA